MENSLSVPTIPIERCAACFTNVVNDDVYCSNCGYPLKGSAQEQRDFIAKQHTINVDIAVVNKRVRAAGNTLYYLSGIFILSGIINFFISKDDPDVAAIVIPIFILAILFLVLGEYSKKKPLACIISGLALYAIVQVLSFIDNPANIAHGIIIKIIIIGFLIKGVKSAIEIEKIKKENNIT
jgi:hypothetical protein